MQSASKCYAHLSVFFVKSVYQYFWLVALIWMESCCISNSVLNCLIFDVRSCERQLHGATLVSPQHLADANRVRGTVNRISDWNFVDSHTSDEQRGQPGAMAPWTEAGGAPPVNRGDLVYSRNSSSYNNDNRQQSVWSAKSTYLMKDDVWPMYRLKLSTKILAGPSTANCLQFAK